MYENTKVLHEVSVMIRLTEGHPLHKRHLNARDACTRVIRRRGQRIKRCDRRKLKQEFLRRYTLEQCVTPVCQEIGIARNTFYSWLKRDPQFSTDYQAIIDARVAAYRADFERHYQPQLEDHWQHASDGALIGALKRMHRSEKWW